MARVAVLAAVVWLIAACGTGPTSSPAATLEPPAATSNPEPDWTKPPLPADATSDCDGIFLPTCLAAASEAYAFGIFPQPSQGSILGWRVRPTSVRSCGSEETPKYDVTFAFRDGATLIVTVAALPNGRLVACTY